MSRMLCLLIGAGLACHIVWSAEDLSLPLHIQFVRATNQEKPKNIKWRPVGAKLSKHFSSMLNWKSYWEVSCEEISVKRGVVSKVHLSELRDLAVEIINDQQLEFRLYQNGELKRKVRQCLQARNMEILGGASEADNAWFVVVRRDKPQGSD